MDAEIVQESRTRGLQTRWQRLQGGWRVARAGRAQSPGQGAEAGHLRSRAGANPALTLLSLFLHL